MLKTVEQWSPVRYEHVSKPPPLPEENPVLLSVCLSHGELISGTTIPQEREEHDSPGTERGDNEVS